MIRTLLVDNHDSFTWNLVHDLTRVNGTEPVVIPNDWEDWSTRGEQLLDRVDNVVISPGPGTPRHPADVGICPEVIAGAGARRLPVLGICLGHQLIAHLHGAEVDEATEPVHGRISQITHDGGELFRGIPSPFPAVRYHSLAVTDVPSGVRVDARSEDGTVMALSVPGQLRWGVQFHPESVETRYGVELLANFAGLTRRARGRCEVRDTVVPLDGVNTRLLTGELFPRLYGADSAAGPAVWLDGNAVGDPRARFSMMGSTTGPHAGPDAAVATADVAAGTVTVTRAGQTRTHHRPVLDWLAADLAHRGLRPAPAEGDFPTDDAPTENDGFPFRLGWVGYLGYGVKQQCGTGEGAVNTVPAAQPDATLVFLDRAVVVDHERGVAHLLVLDDPAVDDPTGDAWVRSTAATLTGVLDTLRHGSPSTPADHGEPSATVRIHDRDAYTDKVRRIRELIRAGETYEACLTITLPVSSRAGALELYSVLRRDNPAPFGAYLRLPGVTVMSTSPERFLRVGADGVITSSPIKGTRPVGTTAEEDRRLREELRCSGKDRAENLMIVDLVRHDLGRVAAPGSVQVPKLFAVESYATVHQLVSTVTARLGEGATGVDAVRAAFPPGSMTGAPKERTMRILEELEDAPRGVYSGALGYFSLDGAVDLSVVIRTLVGSDGGYTYGVGGAVVFQSDPDAEYDETVVKTAPVRRLGLDSVSDSVADRAEPVERAPETVGEFRARWESVRAQVDDACRQAGRDPSEVRLLPVSKTVSAGRLRAAVDAGMTELAENRPQEIRDKAGELPGVRWVAIGHLQTNKARVVAELAEEFQALDSVRIAEVLQHRLELADRTLDVLVQVNTSGEEAKTGAPPEEVDAILVAAAGCDRLRVRGFMTVAVHSEDAAEVRRCFRMLREIRDRARQQAVVDPELLTELSMGMSGDFGPAIAEGATCVRVGTALFGPREYR